jgi:hypothetical protein
MKIIIAIIVLFISTDSFSQTASSKPLSAVLPDSLRRVNHPPSASPGALPSEKALPEVATRSKEHVNRPISRGQLPGNAPVNIDSIKTRSRRFLKK